MHLLKRYSTESKTMSVVLIWETEMNLKQTTVLTSPQIKPEKQPYTITITIMLTSNVQTITFFSLPRKFSSESSPCILVTRATLVQL